MQEKFTLVLAADGSAMITAVGRAEASLDGLKNAADSAGASLGRMPQAAAGLGKVDQSLKQVGMSAAATSAALRNVPAQFTDIVVSLQSGQSPLTVLLQQGGQLKDMFGGIGPAARALGGYVAGLVSPLTMVAAAAGGVGLAYYQVTRETDRFRSSLLMTGNAASTSVLELNSMAAAMDNGFGQTVGKSAEALTALVSTGRVASGNLQAFAQTAIDTEKSFGQSLDATAKHFAELGKDPVGASARLNESLNYLTTTTYEQIRAAKALGDEERASSLAQDAYAQAMRSRAAVVVENLGYVERAWRGLISTAKEGWDAILGVGRSFRESAVSDQIAKLQKELDLSDKGLRNISERQREAIKQQINLLGESERMLKRGNEAQAQRSALEKAGIAATDAVAKANERAATKQEQLNKALKDYRDNLAAIRAANPTSAALDPAQVAKTEAAIRDQFKASPGSGAAGASEAQRQAKGYLELAQSIRAKIDAQTLELAQGATITAAQKQQIELERLVATGKISARDASSEKTQVLLRELSASEDAMRIQRDRQKADEEAARLYAAASQAQDKRNESLQAEVEKQREYIATLGLSESAVTALEAAKLRDQATTLEGIAIKKLDKDLDYARYEQTMAEVKLLRELAGLKEQAGAKKAVTEEAKAATAEWTKFTDQVNQSLTDSLMRAFESGGNFFKTFWNAIVNTLKTTVLKAIIQPVVGGLTGALGFAAPAAASAASAAGGLSPVMGGLGALGGLASAFGTGMAASFSSMMAAGVSGWATAAGSLIGSGATAGIAAGLGMVAAPLLAAAVLYKPLFGRGPRVVQAQGIEGTFSTDGADLRGFEDWTQKGSAFRRSRRGTNYSSLDQGTSDFFNDSLVQITAATKAYANILGLNADSINGITQSVRINLKGLDAAGREKAITDALGGFGDTLAAKLLESGQAFMQAGETTGAALARLGGSLKAVNTTFDALNIKLMATSLAGADTASKLIDAFGGADKFAQLTGAYFQAFYTEGERAAAATRQLTDAFSEMGLSLPASKDAFKALVQSQDLTTVAGRDTFAALMALAPAFDQITQALEQLGKGLTDEVQRLRGLLTSSSSNSLAALQSDFALNTAAARAGDKTALERLPGISQALESASALQAVSAADLAIMRGQLAASLEATAAAIGISVPSIAAISPGTGYAGIDPGMPRYTVGPVEPPPRYEPLPVLTPLGPKEVQSDPALRQEVRDLKTQMQELVKVMLKNEKNTAETNDLWRRLTRGGEVMPTEAST